MSRGITRHVYVALVAGAVAALAGPRLLGRGDVRAGRPFAYDPPAGFVAVAAAEGGGAEAAWRASPVFPGAMVPRLTLRHASGTTQVTEVAAETLARGMPEEFARAGVTWVLARREVHVRPDGTRILLLEGACAKGDTKFRAFQAALPEDDGTAIVMAYYAEGEREHWEPLVLASIDRAQGVALRTPSPGFAAEAGWGAGAFAAAFALSALLSRGRGRASPHPGAGAPVVDGATQPTRELTPRERERRPS